MSDTQGEGVKVWIVHRNVHHEGPDILGVYTNERSACRAAAEAAAGSRTCTARKRPSIIGVDEDGDFQSYVRMSGGRLEPGELWWSFLEYDLKGQTTGELIAEAVVEFRSRVEMMLERHIAEAPEVCGYCDNGARLIEDILDDIKDMER